MNIDDFLERAEFKALDRLLTEEMYSTAGADLFRHMVEVLETEKDARRWFYSSIPSLNGDRPYDRCKKGCADEIENLLGRIEHGVY